MSGSGNRYRLSRLPAFVSAVVRRLSLRIRSRLRRYRLRRSLSAARLRADAQEVRDLVEALRRSGCRTVGIEQISLLTRLGHVENLCQGRAFEALSLEERMDVHRFILHTRSRLLHTAFDASPPTSRLQ